MFYLKILAESKVLPFDRAPQRHDGPYAMTSGQIFSRPAL